MILSIEEDYRHVLDLYTLPKKMIKMKFLKLYILMETNKIIIIFVHRIRDRSCGLYIALRKRISNPGARACALEELTCISITRPLVSSSSITGNWLRIYAERKGGWGKRPLFTLCFRKASADFCSGVIADNNRRPDVAVHASSSTKSG